MDVPTLVMCWLTRSQITAACTGSGKLFPVTVLAYQKPSFKKPLNGYELICIEPTPGQPTKQQSG